MEDQDGEKKKFSIGTILFWLAVLGVIGYFVAPSILNPPYDMYTDGLEDPEKAVRTYQYVAYRFTKMQEGIGFMEMEKVVPEADWAWYENNVDTIGKMDFGSGLREQVTSGIDPTMGAAINKRVALNMVIESGCYSPNAEILNKQIGENEATITCRTVSGETQSQTDWKVKVIRDGSLWKVSGFACGKNQLMGTGSPGEVTSAPLGGGDAELSASGESAEGASPADAVEAAADGTAAPAEEPAAEPAGEGSALDMFGSAEESGDSASPLDALGGGADTDPFGASDAASADDAPAEGASTDDPFASLGGEAPDAESLRDQMGKKFAEQMQKKLSSGEGPGGAPAPAAGVPAPRTAAAGKPAPAPPAKPAAAPAAKPGAVPAVKPGAAPVAKPAAKPPAPAPAGKVDPALLAPADALLKQAAADWDGARYRQAVVNAEKALAIYQRNLGETHPKIAEVQRMIDAAKAKADEI